MKIKELMIGAAIGAAAGTTGTIVGTADQYVAGAEKTVMETRQTADGKLPPQQFRFATIDGKPFVIVPGSKYRLTVERDGKIIGEARYVPDADVYPKEYGHIWRARVKWDIVPDVTSDGEQANEIYQALGLTHE